MLIKIGKSAVSAKEVKNVFLCSHADPRWRVEVVLFDGTEIREIFSSESEAESSMGHFIQQVNNALKGY
jgi:hypothetical protein